MDWFLIALIPPALWSITNHLDKYLLTKYFKGGGVGALMLFSSFIGLLICPIIAVTHPEVLQNFKPEYLLIVINGFFFILAVLPFFTALKKDDASVAVPLFQLIPVYSYVLAFVFLGETLTLMQTLGGAIVITGAVLMALDLTNIRKFKVKKEVLGLMALSSLFFAINFNFFKYFALDADFWTTSFWEYVGFAVFAFLILIFVKSYRQEFFSALKQNSLQVISINGANELINVIAKLAFNFASLFTPITLTWIVNGFQPLFVFIYGVILTIFFPRFSQENISRRVILQKLAAIVVMLIGTLLINQSF